MKRIDINDELDENNFNKIRAVSPKLAKDIKKGENYVRQDKWDKALPHFLKIWKEYPDNEDSILVLVQCLVRLGVREQAIGVLQYAFQKITPTPAITQIMIQLAGEMDAYSTAEKLAHQLVAMEPNQGYSYYYLASAYMHQEKNDEAIDLLQTVIPQYPDYADLWNTLAIAVRGRDGPEASLVFFEEALKLAPDSFVAPNNLAKTYGMMGDMEASLKYNLEAIKLNPKSAEPKMGAALCQFYLGDLEQAWANYEARLDPRRSVIQAQHYTHGLPRWNGENLEGKSIFVVAEQGIGDEVMFGNCLPFLNEKVGKLYIGCDKRLMSIYQRAFPDAIVDGYGDIIRAGYRYRIFPDIEKRMKEGELSIDYAIPVGSLPQYFWDKPENIASHPRGFLSADVERKRELENKIRNITDGKPVIGLAWQSGNLVGERRHLYPDIDDLSLLFDLNDKVHFLNLQYGDCSEDLKLASEKYKTELINFDDVDLRNDIEANLALIECCDAVVCSGTATAQFAIAVDCPAYILSQLEPWWRFGCEGRIPFSKNSKALLGDGNLKVGYKWTSAVLASRDLIVKNLGL